MMMLLTVLGEPSLLVMVHRGGAMRHEQEMALHSHHISASLSSNLSFTTPHTTVHPILQPVELYSSQLQLCKK